MEIQFLKLAQEEINSIKQHIKVDYGQEKADEIVEDLITAISRLKTAPAMGHLPRELHNFPLQNVLEIVAVNETYRVIYELYPKKNSHPYCLPLSTRHVDPVDKTYVVNSTISTEEIVHSGR